uniref:Adenosylmethionine-8-amino-7-oxononanoate aminotransferase n=1 Tax=Paenibacillus athensensis TaxID=1967502 RepID=A0A4Y8PZ01_9BACL
MKAWDLEYLWHPYTQMANYADEQRIIVKAKDWHVYDSDGNEYIDGISGLWNVNVGHGRAEIIDSIHNQLSELDFYALNGYSYESAIRLAKKLVEISPRGLEKVFFSNGGSEANETAIKLARAYWKLNKREGKYKVISLNSAWHGGTLGALSASHIASEKKHFEPLLTGFVHMPQPNCYRCPFGQTAHNCAMQCAAYLREIIAHEDESTIAAFIAEPIQGLGGVIIPPEQYWPMIRQICDENNILLIIDEVATGFGRTGTTFAISEWGITPDMLVCSKGITSGYLPLSAVLATNEIYRPFLQEGSYFQHGYTTGGHPASCAAAIANIELMEREQLLDPPAERKHALLSRFDKLKDLELVGDIRGRGHMVCVELVLDKVSKTPYPHARKLCGRLMEKGIIVRPIGNCIPFFPPLHISEADMDKVVAIYAEVISEACRQLAPA